MTLKTSPLTDILEDQELIENLVHEYGTPTYVYSGRRIRANVQRVIKAMSTHLPRYQLLYALKSNMNPALLQVIQSGSDQIGGDCSSPGELKTALESGFPVEKLIYTGNYESRDDLNYALDSGIKINFDDITSYQRCREIRIPEFVSFRINPGSGKGTYPGITTAGKDVKFGVVLEKAETAYQLAIEDGVTRFGIHTMVGSGILDNDYFVWNCRRMLEIARSLEETLHIDFEYIDMGGGFGIPYRDEEQPLDVEKIFAEVGLVYREYYPDDGPILTYELGRYLVGDAGFILSEVTGTKSNDKFFAGLDVGMNSFIRPALYGAYHRIVPLLNGNDLRNHQQIDFTGQICENTDRLARDRDLPELSAGDRVAICDTGAYGFCFASQYNGRPLPAEVLLDTGGTHLIRKRESLDELNRNVVLPEVMKG